MLRILTLGSLLLAWLLLAPMAQAEDNPQKKEGAKARKAKVEKQENADQAKAAKKKQRGDKKAAAGLVKSIDAAGKSVTITVNNKKQGTSEDKTFVIADDAKVTLRGQPATLSDVPVGKRARLTLSDDGQKVVAVAVGQPKKQQGNAQEKKEKKKPKENKPAA